MTSVRFKIELAKPKAAKPRPPKLPRDSGPTRSARRLALAYWIERQVDAGKIADYAAAAKLLGLSRTRLTHVVSLALLPVEMQEDLLFSRRRVSERELRNACGAPRAHAPESPHASID